MASKDDDDDDDGAFIVGCFGCSFMILVLTVAAVGCIWLIVQMIKSM